MRKPFYFIAAVGFSWALALQAAEGPLVGPGVTGKKLPSGETVGADVGAGPHKERDLNPAPRVQDAVDEIPPASRPASRDGEKASTGASRNPNATSGADNDAVEADEARASRNKDKFKNRPGYQENPPQPQAKK